MQTPRHHYLEKTLSPDDGHDDIRSRTMGECHSRELTAETGSARATGSLPGTLEGRAGAMDGLSTGMHKAVRQQWSEEMHRVLLRRRGETRYV